MPNQVSRAVAAGQAYQAAESFKAPKPRHSEAAAKAEPTQQPKPAAIASISDKGQAAAAKAAEDSQVEKATREAASRNNPNSQANVAAAANLLKTQLGRAS